MSNFCPDTGRGGLLFRFACSVALWGGRGAVDRYHWCVWGALAAFRPHWVCPCSQVCAFPIYTAQAPSCSIWSGPCIACGSSFRVLHKSADSGGPAFCAFPSLSSSGSQELDRHTLLGAVHLLPSAVPASSPRAPVGCVCLVTVLRSWPLAETLPTNVYHPESQEVFG